MEEDGGWSLARARAPLEKGDRRGLVCSVHRRKGRGFGAAAPRRLRRRRLRRLRRVGVLRLRRLILRLMRRRLVLGLKRRRVLGGARVAEARRVFAVALGPVARGRLERARRHRRRSHAHLTVGQQRRNKKKKC